MKAVVWKPVQTYPLPANGLSTELVIHCGVYALVRKGLLLDTPLYCYASHHRSQGAVMLQFGNGHKAITCSGYDGRAIRQQKREQVFSLLQKHGISHVALSNVLVEGFAQLGGKDGFQRVLCRFVV